MKVKIIAEMACAPEQWMCSGPFEDRFDTVEISEPDKIMFTATVDSTEDNEVDSLIYDIEDHFNELGIDYMDIYLEEEN